MERYSTLANIVGKFHKKKLMVIGDLMLDHFIWGDVSRISPEAPVPIVKVDKENYMPGGACNVATNLATLGASVLMVGVVGEDSRAEILKEQLEEEGIDVRGLVVDSGRETILKSRVIASHRHQHVVRIDRESSDVLSKKVLNRVINYVCKNIESVDGIIIEDYGKGLITPYLISKVVKLAKKLNKMVAVDPKENHFEYYKGVSVVTPNHHEAANFAGFSLEKDEDLIRAGKMFLNKLKLKAALITLGEKGMMLFQAGKKPCHIPTFAKDVFDVSGAGDTVIATYTLAVISGASPKTAAGISNCAAGIVVGKSGVVPIYSDELLSGLKKLNRKAKR